MTNVLHVGAAEGEVEFYRNLGVEKLVYAEPDQNCLIQLRGNINRLNINRSLMQVNIIPKACSSLSGESLKFFANGSGQSSLEKPESRTKQMVGDNFECYNVETISLVDLKQSTFKNEIVNYLCIDTQGHEKSIICSSDSEYLNLNFNCIDVELMTDVNQYAIPAGNWKDVVLHLLRSGFEPIIHPHGITESYIFLNKRLGTNEYNKQVINIRDALMTEFFNHSEVKLRGMEASSLCAIGDHYFLPFANIGGAIHASQLQPFREKFVSMYLSKCLLEG